MKSVMRASQDQRGRCFFCSLQQFVRWSLRAPNKRPFATTSNLSRNRAAERISKGRWKEPTLGFSQFGQRTAQPEAPYTRTSLSKNLNSVNNQKVIHLLGSGKPVAELELVRLKEILQTGKTPDGAQAEYAELDPELKYFDTFEAKVTQCFEAKNRKKREADPVNPLRVSLSQAFFHGGRDQLRRTLLFAYIDHVVESQQNTAKISSTPRHLDLRYPTEWYGDARATQRQIHLHVGPTNSGKTYHALKRLEESANGLYAGPLRLLAHEVYSRFNSKGVPCSLVTGDDVRYPAKGEAKFSSHTVEMIDCGRDVDVAVIDEIQMIASEDRGWAWTRAVLATKAKELHLCGETRVIPLIRELAASMGDTLHIHHYDRLNPLKAMSKSLRGNLKSLRRGDCIVSFSVLGIHAMKKQIEVDTGRRVAIVYGSLPPEIRAQQATLFNDPSNDYDFLVASDAIGMGLNLSIKRIIFETIWKSNGSRREKLTISQIKQIAGRAGRYRTASHDEKEAGTETKVIDSQDSRVLSYKGSVKQSNVGLVTCLDENHLGDIQIALNSEPEPIRAAGLQPPVHFVDAFANSLPPGTPFEYLLQRLNEKAVLNPRYFMCSIRDQSSTANCIDKVKGLSVVQSCILSAAPADNKTDLGKNVLQALARCIAGRTAVTVADVLEIPLDALDQPLSGDREYLLQLELLHKSLVLYLWLAYRFSNIFLDKEMASHAKEMVEDKINSTLLQFSANPKLRDKLLLMRHTTGDKDAAVDSGDKAEDDVQGRSGSGPVEEELAESLNDLPSLPVDWENRTADSDLNANTAALEIRQPATAQP